MRVVNKRELCHDRLGDRFAEATSDHDTQRRLEILIDDFLAPAIAPGTTALDVGCGLGFFSEALHRLGAKVTACDLGPNLIERTRKRVGCESVLADALALTETFGNDRFDLVVSSECIEHTPDPSRALQQMAAVLKPGGLLAVSTPNRLWHPVVALATALRLRPFDGYENFSSFRSIRATLEKSGLQVVQEKGLHLFPFQLRLGGLSRWCDRNMQFARGVMINLCVLAKKPAVPAVAAA